MDFLPHHEALSHWLLQYGSIVLFVMLAVGILILPVPEETMMILAGVLMYKGDLSIPFTVLAAFGGSILGISISYIIGHTAGHFLIMKYGRWVGITEKHLNKAHDWFEHFGKWTLMIGYFIPGVRHFTGVVSGMTYMKYSHFALFAYSGAVIWVSIFLSLGYFFGDVVSSFFENFEIDADAKIAIVITIFVILLILILFIKFYPFSNSKSK